MENAKCIRYNRSRLYDYDELTPEQQVNVVSNYFNNELEAREDSFVIATDHSPMPLGIFMTWDHKPFDGVHNDTVWSGWFIKFNYSYDEVLLVYKSW